MILGGGKIFPLSEKLSEKRFWPRDMVTFGSTFM